MTTKITSRSAVCLLMCVMTVSFIACAGSKSNLVNNSDGDIREGKESLIKERKIDAKYIRDICKRAKWVYDVDKYRMEGGNYSWYIYLPSNTEEAPPGICVYISPRGGSFANADRWKDIMDERNLICLFLTGDFDANREQTRVNYYAYLGSGIKNCAYIQVKGMGHAYPPPEYWQAAFAYLDGNDLNDAMKEKENMMTAFDQ